MPFSRNVYVSLLSDFLIGFLFSGTMFLVIWALVGFTTWVTHNIPFLIIIMMCACYWFHNNNGHSSHCFLYQKLPSLRQHFRRIRFWMRVLYFPHPSSLRFFASLLFNLNLTSSHYLIKDFKREMILARKNQAVSQLVYYVNVTINPLLLGIKKRRIQALLSIVI